MNRDHWPDWHASGSIMFAIPHRVNTTVFMLELTVLKTAGRANDSLVNTEVK